MVQRWGVNISQKVYEPFVVDAARTRLPSVVARKGFDNFHEEQLKVALEDSFACRIREHAYCQDGILLPV
jgi:hypothetical protein